MTEWASCWTPDTWRDYLYERADADADLLTIRDQTSLGRPLGSASFVQQLEQQTGRRFQFGPVGRPKKEQINQENEGDE
jgi:hypothetical protein